jgi:hypothetical protein
MQIRLKSNHLKVHEVEEFAWGHVAETWWKSTEASGEYLRFCSEDWEPVPAPLETSDLKDITDECEVFDTPYYADFSIRRHAPGGLVENVLAKSSHRYEIRKVNPQETGERSAFIILTRE